MRILIFGGSGRLGGAFKRVLGASHELLAPTSKELDLTDSAAVAEAVALARSEWVVNLAAYNNVDGAEGEGAGAAMRLNAYAPALIARAAAASGAKLLHLSTDYVFAGDKPEGYVEEDIPAPVSAYGISKFLGELAVHVSHPGAHVVRTSRLYGPKGEGVNSKPSFVEIVFDLAAKSKNFSINASEVSAPTFVDDLAEHLARYVIEGTPPPGIYHVANAGGCTWREWAQAIVEEAKLEAVVTPRDPAELARPARRPAFSVLHSTKLPTMRPWREALRAYLKSLA